MCTRTLCGLWGPWLYQDAPRAPIPFLVQSTSIMALRSIPSCPFSLLLPELRPLPPPPQHLLAGPLFMLPSWSLGFMFCPRTVRMIFLKWFDSNDFPVSYPLIACRIQLILLNVVCKTLHVLPLPSCLPVTWYTLCSNATKLPHLMQLAGACLKHLAGCPLHANSSFKNQLSGPLMQSSLINPDRVNQTLLCTATVANSYLNCCTLWIRDQLKGTDCILLLYLPLVPKRVQMCILDT